MLYNRRVVMYGEEFTLLDLIYRHYDYKKNCFNPSRFMINDSETEKERRHKLLTAVRLINRWAVINNIKGESEYIITKYIREVYEYGCNRSNTVSISRSRIRKSSRNGTKCPAGE